MEKDATPVGDKMDKPVQDPMEYFRQQSKLLSQIVFEESDEEVVGLPVKNDYFQLYDSFTDDEEGGPLDEMSKTTFFRILKKNTEGTPDKTIDFMSAANEEATLEKTIDACDQDGCSCGREDPPPSVPCTKCLEVLPLSLHRH